MFHVKHFGTIDGQTNIRPVTAGGAGNGCCCRAKTEIHRVKRIVPARKKRRKRDATMRVGPGAFA